MVLVEKKTGFYNGGRFEMEEPPEVQGENGRNSFTG